MWCRSKLELKFEVNEWSKELGKLEETERMKIKHPMKDVVLFILMSFNYANSNEQSPIDGSCKGCNSNC